MYVPERIVTNADLSKLMSTSDEWIQQRCGIKERRFVADGEGPSDLAVRAATEALKAARLSASDIDLLLVATLSPEHYFPGTSLFVQRKLGMTTTPAMDIRGQCSGFVYGLSVANSFISSGQYKKILLIGVEVHSRGLEFNDRGRDMAVLFGDGAGACVIEQSKSHEHGIMNVILHSEGTHAEKLWVEYPSMARSPHCPPSVIEEGRMFPKMDGKFVFKNAVVRIPEVISETLTQLSLNVKDVDHFILHQANLRINEFIASGFGLPPERFPTNIARYGNCSAASIPILLDEHVKKGLVRTGDILCLAAFGSGFTWGSSIIRWG